ncbi:MAG: hypothetical protein CVU48_00325 [Candidatus Cloacimonetes bacterium HGW-Cloacimonetes-1]|nr:MAG: hypothetical protein CVU48_00325 [Candidatus Cloacimonetes bacterium HGW-Cloacimonetes-1]
MNQDARILVVDDDDVIIKIITNILHKNGYTTESCHSGEEALELIKQSVFDLVLLDVQMGKGMDGYETCRLMQIADPDLPVILVTANQDDVSVNNGFESGSSDYIKKPVSKLELLARVNKTISLKRTEKKNLQLLDDLRKDLRTAANIQEAILPKWIYIDKNIVFSSNYQASDLVGGDLFDRIKIDDNRYVVYIGDISGHGVQAALLMTAIKSIIKIMVETEKDTATLAQLFTKLNEKLYSELFTHNNYMTMLMGVLDLEINEFRFLNAGHPPLIIIDSTTNTAVVHDKKGSVPLGWMPRTIYYEHDMDSIPLNENNIYLLYTDGIYECNNPQDEQFGLDGLIDVLNNHIPIDSCINLSYKIKHHLLQHQYEISTDDFTLFSFKTHSDKKHFGTKELTAGNETRHFTFVLRAALKEVGIIAKECEQIIIDWTQDSGLAAKVELVVDEFLNNIIQYGYNYSEDSIIVLEFVIHDGTLSIRFWDKGILWEPPDVEFSFEQPYEFEDEMMNERGKGLKIIMSITNKFTRKRYEQLNETTVEILI